MVALVEQHFAVFLQVYEVGVRRGDYGCSLMTVGLAGDLYVQLLGDAALELYGDMVGVDILLALLERVWREVFYHLQLIFRLADDGSESDGNRQSDHARAGYAHAHGVLKDVGREQCRDFLRAAAQQLRSASHAERHAHRLGAADGWHYLAIDKGNDLFANVFFKHIV